MVGINLFGFRKFELLRGEGEGGGGGEGPGGGGIGSVSVGEAGRGGGANASAESQSGADVGAGGFNEGFAPDAQFSDEDVGAGATQGNTQNLGVSPGQALAQVGITSFGDIADGTNVDIAGMQPESLDFATEVGTGTAPGSVDFDVEAALGLDQAAAEDASISFAPSIDTMDAMSDVSSDDDAAMQAGITGLLGGDPVSPVSFTATDAATTGMDINPAALAAATGIVGAGISDPTATGVQDPSGLTVDTGLTGGLEALGISPVEVSRDPTNTSGGTTTSIVGTSMFDNMRDLMAQEEATNNPAVADLDAGMGAAIAANEGVTPVDFTADTGFAVPGASANVADLGVDLGAGSGTGIDFTPGIQEVTSPSGNLSIDAIASFNEAMSNQNPNNPAAAESLMGAPVGTGTDFNAAALDAMLGDDAVSTVDALSVAQDPSEVTDTTFNPTAFEEMTGLDITGANANIADSANQTGLPELSAMTAPFASSSGYPSIDNFAAINQGIIDDNANTSGVTADTLYGTSLVTGLPTTAMSPIEAQAMTGGSMSTTNNTGMNLAQQTNNVEATNQAEAMDVLGAQIGAGNLTGNETIDQVNIALAEQGVQIDTSGLPGILGTGVNAVNQNYQLNQNQDILTQLAQGTGNDDATNTGILGTGIGAVTDVNTYTPAYNAQGQIVGSVATDAAGNAVGGGAGITTNVVGGLGAMDDVYSDAAGTNLYGDVNEAVGDFKDMVAASQDSDEGPPQDVTSVDANGCVIGAEFFDGQKCSPIGSTVTGDATGGGTGGGFTPYNYQPGQGTMLKPDFSDLFTSKVDFSGINPNASNMNFLKPAVNPYGNFAGGGIVNMMRNNRYR